MLTDWLDVITEDPARMAGLPPERYSIQLGGGLLAAGTNILFEEFTTTVLNTVGKALIGLGVIADVTEIFPVQMPRLIPVDERTKQELLVIAGALTIDGIYRAVRNLASTQTALNQFISTLQSGNIVGALQSLFKNPFGAVTQAAFIPPTSMPVSMPPRIIVSETGETGEEAPIFASEDLTVPSF